MIVVGRSATCFGSWLFSTGSVVTAGTLRNGGGGAVIGARNGRAGAFGLSTAVALRRGGAFGLSAPSALGGRSGISSILAACESCPPGPGRGGAASAAAAMSSLRCTGWALEAPLETVRVATAGMGRRRPFDPLGRIVTSGSGGTAGTVTLLLGSARPRRTVEEATRQSGQGIRRISIWLEQLEQKMW